MLAGLVVAALAALGVAWVAWRARAPRGALASHADPAPDYAAAASRASALQSRDPAGLDARCGTRLYTHGHRVARCVVIFHGLTNCPRQCDRIARELYDRGCNVLVPLQPHHGLADRMTRDLASLRAEELTRLADESVDIAHGLGEHVTVAGLSVGGVQAAWAAQERSDVDAAVLIAPMCGLSMCPPALTPAVAGALRGLPNAFVWWDPRVREKVPGPTQVYPRFSTRAVGEVLALAEYVRQRAGQAPPRARSIHLVLSGSDLAIGSGRARDLVARWRARGARVDEYEFPAAFHLGHDLLDPEQPYAKPELSYPVLVERMLK